MDELLLNPAFSVALAIAGVVITILIELIGISRRIRLRRRLEDGERAITHSAHANPELVRLTREWARELTGRLVHPSVSGFSAHVIAYFVVVLLFLGASALLLASSARVPPFVIGLMPWMQLLLAVILSAGPSAVLFSIAGNVVERAGWFWRQGSDTLARQDLSSSRQLAFGAWTYLTFPVLAVFLMLTAVSNLIVRLMQREWIANDSQIALAGTLLLASVSMCLGFAAWRDRVGRHQRRSLRGAVKHRAVPEKHDGAMTKPSPSPLWFFAGVLVGGLVGRAGKRR